MPRTNRVTPGGMVFHVLNRGVGRQRLFDKPADYAAFEEVLEETLLKHPVRICSYCVMPNHWHLLLWPEGDGDLATFMQRLTVTHVTRWQRHRRRVGEGHVYQGRFKSFPVETDDYFYQVARDVERNALRANLVKRAEDWQWSSLWRREQGTADQRRLLGAWPMPRPRRWVELVNEPQTDAELQSLRKSVLRGQPYGSTSWIEQTTQQLGLESTLHPRGISCNSSLNNRKMDLADLSPFPAWPGETDASSLWNCGALLSWAYDLRPRGRTFTGNSRG